MSEGAGEKVMSPDAWAEDGCVALEAGMAFKALARLANFLERLRKV